MSDIAPKTALLLLAVGINALEYLFPRIPFLPWLKPGMANAVTIIWIIRWGAADALLFSMVRTWITSFYFGFSLVSLVLSMSGGLLAAAGMGVLWNLFGKRGWLGLAGLGIAGAALHNIGQLGAVYAMLTATAAIWYQAPFMLAASIVFGALSGLLGHALLPTIGTETVPGPSPVNGTADAPVASAGLRLIAGIAIIAGSIAIVPVRSPVWLGAAAAGATILAAGLAKRKIAVLVYPVTRFWLLFVFIAVMYLFFSYGRAMAGIPFVTHEGVRETLLQWLRVWTWIELSTILSRLEFNRIVLRSAMKRLPFGQETFAAAILALELFPPFVDLLKGYLRIDVREVMKNPGRVVDSTIRRLYGDIGRLIGGG
jgi:heptaprenyl diphosphate synthase